MRVPADIKVMTGLCEIRRTLGVHTLTQARPIALKLTTQIMEIFEMLRKQKFSKEDARRLVTEFFQSMSRDLDQGFTPETTDPEMEIAAQRAAWDEVSRNIKDQIETRSYGSPVVGYAKGIVERNGHDWNDIAPSNRQDVLAGVSRALLEAHRHFLYRLEEQLLPYTPTDPLFKGTADIRDQPNSPQPLVARMSIHPSEPVGPTVGTVVDHFVRSNTPNWNQKTLKARLTRLGYLVDFLGADRILSTVTTADVREFSERLLKFRNRNTSRVGTSFSEKQTDNPDHRISAETANLIFITIKLFFNWAKSKKGYIERNPAEDVVIDVPKPVKKAQKARRPFSADDLVRLFQAPLFTGCLGVHRRFDPGKHVIRDDYFWVPLLGYFTGMRLGEIIQLHIDDVNLAGPIPYIDVTDLNSGEIGSGLHKSIKSEAGVRKVPLHPDIMAIGFADFIQRRRKEKHASSKRVFWKIAYGADGQASTVFSKWFSRFLDKIGLTDPALVFHSFRHNAEDSFRNAMLPQQVIDRIIGHSDDATSAGYGEGLSLETAYKAVNAMEMKVKLTHLFK